MTETMDETAVIAALRDVDESVFAQLVDNHTPFMLRAARGYLPSHDVAEEVVVRAKEIAPMPAMVRSTARAPCWAVARA